MNKPHIFLICLIIIVISSLASATWVPLTGDPIPLGSLSYGMLTVGDKEFFGFNVGRLF